MTDDNIIADRYKDDNTQPELMTIALSLDLLPLTEEFDKVSVVIQVDSIDEDGLVDVRAQTRGVGGTVALAEMLEDLAVALRQGTITQEEDSEEVALAKAKAAHPAGGGFNPEVV
jgi:hypothetical protein